MSVSAGSVKVQLDAGASGFMIAMAKAATAVNGIGTAAAGAVGKLQGLGKAFADAKADADKFDGLKDLGGGIAKYAGAAAVALTGLGVYAAKSAEDLGEIGDEIQRTFGDRAPQVQAFADTLSRDLGLSAVESRKAMVDLGNQLTYALGDTSAAEAQSKAMVQLAADLAAAKNVSFDEALGALTAGLRGATRGLAQYGIFMSEDAVKQKAMAMGVADANAQLSEQQQVVVRLALAMEQGGKYMGEAAKDTATLEGQTKLAMEALRQLGRDVGSVLLPPLIKLAEKVAGVVRWFADLSPKTKEWIAYGLAAAAAVSALAAAFGAALVVIGQVGNGIAIVKAILPALTAALGSVGAVFLTVVAAAGVFVTTFTIASKVLEAFGVKNTGAAGAMKALESAIDSLGSGAIGVVRMLLSAFMSLAEVILLPFRQMPVIGEKIDAAMEAARAMADEFLWSFEETGTAAKGAADETGGLGDSLKDLGGTGATDFLKLFRDATKDAKTEAAALNKEIERQVKALEDFAALSASIEAEALAATASPIEQAMSARESKVSELRAKAGAAGIDESALHDLVEKIDRVFIKGLADHLATLTPGTAEFSDAMRDSQEIVEAMGYNLWDLFDANGKLAQSADDLGGKFDGITGSMDGATEAVRKFAVELNRPAPGLEQAAGDVAAGVLGGDTLGGAVEGAMGAAGMGPIGALVGGAIESFTDVLRSGAENVSLAFDTLLGTMFRESGKIGETFSGAVSGAAAPLAAGLAAVAVMIAAPLALVAAVVAPVALVFSGVLLPALVILAPALLVLAAATLLAASPLLVLAAAAIAVVTVFAAWSALALTLATAATQTEAYARTTERIGAEFNRLATALEPLIEKLGVGMVNVVARLVDVMLPFATALASSESALGLLFGAVKLAALGFGTLLLVAGHLQNALIDFASWLLDVQASFTADGAEADRLRSLSDSLQDMKVNTDDVAAALAALNAATLEDGRARGRNPFLDGWGGPVIDVVLKDFGDAADEAAESLREVSNSATNVPQGFKVAVSRFRAITADDFGAAPAGTTIATSEGGKGMVLIENVEVRASSLDEIVDQVEEAAERAAFRRSGTTGTRDGLRPLRG